ncbi:MAG: pyridoxamine 5'-phosphate oxidase family protein [Proteobacteria bacterium]|nr:pyridoxamine 5'-phosphate oxidase family protein [Pseudomonadota bacterium]
MGGTAGEEAGARILTGGHRGVVSVGEAGKGPWSVPVWYGYAPGRGLWFVTERSGRLGKLAERAPRLTLCVEASRPGVWVSVEGPVVAMERMDLERDLRPVVRAALGDAAGDRYLEELPPQRRVAVWVAPEDWRTGSEGLS